MDQLRLAGIDFAAQVRDIGLDHVAIAAEIVVPHVVQNLGLRQHHFLVLHQVAQEVELGGRKLDELTGFGDLMGVIIER